MNCIIKKAERFCKVSSFTKVIKDAGGSVKEVAEYSKWHNLRDGKSRIQLKMTIVKMVNGENVGYILEDNLGYLASYPAKDIEELKSLLKEDGYKPIKEWYLQDCGMTEETWNAWNQSND